MFPGYLVAIYTYQPLSFATFWVERTKKKLAAFLKIAPRLIMIAVDVISIT